MVQNKPLCTHNPALMISAHNLVFYMSQRPLLYLSFFDAYSRKIMSLLFKAFPPAALGLHCGVQALKLWCAGWVVVMWDLSSPNRTEPTPALEHRVLSLDHQASPHDASLKVLALNIL